MKWFKWYGQQWLNSTARYELNEAERGLFVDFCSLAACETIGLNEGQFKISSWEALAHKLNASIENVLAARDKCLKSRIGIEEIPGEGLIITILNWHKYQPPFKEKKSPITPIREKDKTRLDKIRAPRKLSSNKHNSVAKTASTNPKIDLLPLPDWIDKELWKDYLEMRKQKKVPATDKAIKLLITKLERLKNNGENPSNILEEAIMRGWTGLFPVQQGGGNGRSGTARNPRELPKTYTAPPVYRD